MSYGSKGGDDTEILGKISKISSSPSGGKRLEVEATFKDKIQVEQPHLPFYMKQPAMKPGQSGKQKIKIDMSAAEAKKFSEDDEIRARIREKYSQTARAGSCGIGGAGDIYNYVEGSSSGSSPSRGSSNSKWDRFKG